jgi:hypothetical protein
MPSATSLEYTGNRISNRKSKNAPSGNSYDAALITGQAIVVDGGQYRIG